MDTTSLLRFDERPSAPWANGLGTTVELWRTPAAGDFSARLSIATVSEPAAFSALPGVGRALMALTPGGLTLRIDGELVELAQYETAEFSGGQEVAAVAVPHPGYDLNLMSRTGRPHLDTLTVSGAATIPEGALAAIVISGGLSFDGTALRFGDVLRGTGVEVSGEGALAIAHVDEAHGSHEGADPRHRPHRDE